MSVSPSSLPGWHTTTTTRERSMEDSCVGEGVRSADARVVRPYSSGVHCPLVLDSESLVQVARVPPRKSPVVSTLSFGPEGPEPFTESCRSHNPGQDHGSPRRETPGPGTTPQTGPGLSPTRVPHVEVLTGATRVLSFWSSVVDSCDVCGAGVVSGRKNPPTFDTGSAVGYPWFPGP